MTRSPDADGFSLIEVIVAIFVLAAISLALVPLITVVAAVSSTNQDSVAATAYANEQLSILRAEYPSVTAATTECSELSKRVAAMKAAAADPDNLEALPPAGLALDLNVVCPPGGYPHAVEMTVTVSGRGSTSEVVLATQFLVGAP